jgi:hypothetical protein
MGEKLFGTAFYEGHYEHQPELLSTIRVPKNLLYLTDRLPKPHYDKVLNKNNRSRDRGEEIEDLKRRTHEPRNDSLPELPIKKKTQKIVRAGDSSLQISQSTRVNPAE